MPKQTTGEKTTWEQVDKTGMQMAGFTKANNALMKEIIYTLDSSAYIVYLILLSHKNEKDAFSFPSLDLVATEANMTRRNVLRIINKLYDSGFIKINSGNWGVSSKYFFPREDFYKEIDCTWKRKGGKKPKAPNPEEDPEFDY